MYRDDIILGDGWIVSPNEAGAKVFAVNRRTGALDWVTQVDNDPDAVITAAPTIYHGGAYFGISSKGEGEVSPTFRGAVVALNATTGKLLWKAYTVPSNNGNSDSNLANGYYTGNAVWGSSPAVDPARGLLYVGTGNNYTAPAGVCDEPGQTNCTPPVADDYVDSILALRLSDGSVAWADHTNNGDIWTRPQPIGPDYDFGAGPTCSPCPAPGSNCSASARRAGSTGRSTPPQERSSGRPTSAPRRIPGTASSTARRLTAGASTSPRATPSTSRTDRRLRAVCGPDGHRRVLRRARSGHREDPLADPRSERLARHRTRQRRQRRGLRRLGLDHRHQHVRP